MWSYAVRTRVLEAEKVKWNGYYIVVMVEVLLGKLGHISVNNLLFLRHADTCR